MGDIVYWERELSSQVDKGLAWPLPLNWSGRLISVNLGAVDWVVSPLHSYIEAITPNAIVFEDGALRT